MNFTAEDRFEPVYCPGCRVHIPAATLQALGKCEPCHAAATEPAEAAQSVKSQPLYTGGVDTQLGQCPNCNSRNMVLTDKGGFDGSTVKSMLKTAVLFAAFGMWARVMGGREDEETSGCTVLRCRDCNKSCDVSVGMDLRQRQQRRWLGIEK